MWFNLTDTDDMGASVQGIEAITGASVFLLIVTIFIILLDVIVLIVFFVMASNVSKIRALLEEWLEIEHPLIEKGKQPNAQKPGDFTDSA